MRRIQCVLGALVLLSSAVPAHAQLTMQMSNGWNFTFSGNVNAFLTYEKESTSGEQGAPFGIVGTAADQTRIQTGLLPAFAVFEAKGKEGNTDLAVHFGFAPEIQCGRGIHDCFGAQIDMRQVFLTAGGSWGQILAGRELGLFARQNILTDQTLFGIGGTGAGGGALGSGGGTTLGRIGFGYPYAQFKAQLTYSTPAGKPGQLSIGVFESDAAALPGVAESPYSKTNIPRIETEFVYSKDEFKGWLGGLLQNTKNPANNKSATATGLAGGLRWDNKKVSVTGSGYWGKGIGTTLLFLGASCTDGTCGENGSGDLRKSYGYIGQITYTTGKVTLAGSYGASILKDASDELVGFKTENALVSGGLYYQATKSLKVVFELNYATTKDKDAGGKKNSSIAPAVGLMLFF
jgi:Gram-negative porin